MGDGPDLQELKEDVMANMMWRPMQDPLLLISEFLEGYYSAAGAPFVRRVSMLVWQLCFSLTNWNSFGDTSVAHGFVLHECEQNIWT